ncbi:MAG: endolytic transglycosylase MltG [Candidatus Paceibacterota bacterium]
MNQNRFFTFLENNRIFSSILLSVVVIGTLCTHLFFWTAPFSFSSQSVFIIEKGTSISVVAKDLAEKNIIRSPLFFKIMVVLIGRGNGVKAGDYFFTKPQNIYEVASRLIKAEYGFEPVKVTIPEGSNIFQISSILEKKLINFDSSIFLSKAKEGYVFPDTYSLLPNMNAEEVLAVMEKNFFDKTKDLKEEIKNSGKTLDEIITMASILEEEARVTETREILSGILWKRIEMGMPLQVDVTFQYVNGKNTYQLSKDDLDIDSPYNTYKYAGLPPTPISNPGLDSIKSALNPKETPYLYFLSDRNGVMYYGKNFEEHKRNRALYLN